MRSALKRPHVVAAAALGVATVWGLIRGSAAIIGGHPSYWLVYGGALLIALAVIIPALPDRSDRKLSWKSMLGAVPLALLAASIIWLTPMQAERVAVDALTSSETVEVTSSASSIVMEPGPASRPGRSGLVFHPGARVDARAYAAMLRPLAEAGHPVVIVKEPLGIAFFGGGFARAWATEHPDTVWAVGGHSLGGVVAAIEAEEGADIGSLLLWGSFPAGDMSDADVGAMSVYGTNDGLSQRDTVEASAADLPPGTEFVPVVGGVHSFFGDYGEQPGDGEPGIDRSEAQRQIIDASLRFMEGVAGSG